MEVSTLESEKIISFKQRYTNGNSLAEEDFLTLLKKEGTPLIEDIKEDNDHSLVTFIYVDNDDCENVVLKLPVDWKDLEKNTMKQIGDSKFWYITYKMKSDIRFNYFFVPNDTYDGDWDKRREKQVYDRYNKHQLKIKKNDGSGYKIFSCGVMPNSEEEFWVKERSTSEKGHLHSHEFTSHHFENNRKIRVYTPSGYSSKNERYPFLVVTDGDEYINALSTINVLDNLIEDKKIPPVVAVFIDATEKREVELKCNDLFARTVAEELIPWVRKEYHISTKPEEAVIGGYSLGGLTASYIGLKHFNTFGNVLSQSGSYWYKPESATHEGDDCWMSHQYASAAKLPLKFYLNVGDLELQDLMIDTNINFKDTLISKGYHVDYETFKSGHDYLCWGETFAKGLMSLLGINRIL